MKSFTMIGLVNIDKLSKLEIGLAKKGKCLNLLIGLKIVTSYLDQLLLKITFRRMSLRPSKT